jgi:hypothetical protein
VADDYLYTRNEDDMKGNVVVVVVAMVVVILLGVKKQVGSGII